MSSTDDEAMRDYARALFTDDEEPSPARPTDPPTGNRVPTEGSNPSTGGGAPADMREYVQHLFGSTY